MKVHVSAAILVAAGILRHAYFVRSRNLTQTTILSAEFLILTGAGIMPMSIRYMAVFMWHAPGP
jgi:hypothetical protein